MSEDRNDAPEPTVDIDDVSFEVPEQIAVLSLEHMVLYPFMIAPLIITEDRGKKLVDDVLRGSRIAGVFAHNPQAPEDATGADRIYKFGTAAAILKMLKVPDGSLRILVHGLKRIRMLKTLTKDPYLTARVEPVEEPKTEGPEVEARIRNAQKLMQRVVELSSLPDDLGVAVMNVNDPGRLADLIVSNLSLKIPEQQEVLEIVEPIKRLESVLTILNRELGVLELGSEIQREVKTSMDRSQREYYLREQLKAIRKELGEGDEGNAEAAEMRRRLKEIQMPDSARNAAEKEISRLESMHPSSAEFTVARTYLDWIFSLPWEVGTHDRLDMNKAKRILDEDHFDLEKVKERILEYLAVLKLRKEIRGPILCFVGPPGVGKTSLGRSIARAMGRKFYRTSLGGMHDEAEIRGHRRTYIGAMPGRIIKGIKDCGSNNPVMMLDEVDKLGRDFRGDPASALLEVLDPEQNSTFLDNYMDMPFDLSKVMFITTANVLESIPGPLRDRMEIIHLSGYTPNEKLQIAKKYLIPRQLDNNGLKPTNVRFGSEAIMALIHDYTREAGLRNLEREIGNVCRKVARRRAAGDRKPVTVTKKRVADMLGAPRFYHEVVERANQPGVAVGLAWTESGGEVLFIESARTSGSGRFTLTGHLGDVMKESAQAALTFLQASARELGIPEQAFRGSNFHIHVPAAAIPKDGPSAGITMCAAIASLLGETPLRERVAMTGEITLKGKVLPVGGIKEKVLAAHRAGVREVVLPARNEKDLKDIPKEVSQEIMFHFAEEMDEVLNTVFPQVPIQKERKRKAAKKRGAGSRKKATVKAVLSESRGRVAARSKNTTRKDSSRK